MAYFIAPSLIDMFLCIWSMIVKIFAFLKKQQEHQVALALEWNVLPAP